MKRPLSPLILAAASLLTLLAPSTLPAAEAAGAKTEASPKLDPQALQALQRMSNTLAAAKAFTYQSRSILEVPARTGQFITLFSNAEVALQRPNKIRASLRGEAPNFNFYYDGSTVAASAEGVYSSCKAPPTIDAMLPDLENETGIRFVTEPLLLSNPYQVLTRHLQSAIVVGPTSVNGVDCVHLAFRSPGVNWEIWIQDGANALPRRLAVTFTDRPNFPRTIIEFTRWNLHPWLNQGQFVFHQPAGAKEIPFVAVLRPHGR